MCSPVERCDNMTIWISQFNLDLRLQFWFSVFLGNLHISGPLWTLHYLDTIAYFHFHSEGRHTGIFSTAHDHLLERVPFIVAADRTFLQHRLSNMFLFDCTLWLCSCCTRSALEGPLHPPSHGPAKLRRGWGRLLIVCSTKMPFGFFVMGVALQDTEKGFV